MEVRITVDLPDQVHELLRHRAERSGTSIRRLIVHALEQVYADTGKREPVTGPLVRTKGKRGPRFPKDENPLDLVFS